MTPGERIYHPKGVALFPTYECPGNCEHCNIPAEGVDTAAVLSVDTGRRVLREAKDAGIGAFQVVGGEPTVYEDFLVEMFAEGQRIGMKRHRPPTNCTLGSDEPRLRALFERLSALGYNSGFRVSLDYYHRRIPVSSVASFIRIASEYFSLKPFIIGCCDMDERRSADMLRRLAELLTESGIEAAHTGKKIETARGDMKTVFWAPTRPTRTPLPDEAVEDRAVSPDAPVGEQMKRGGPIGRYGCLGRSGVGYLWIEPDGGVRLCCGNSVNFTPALKFGNVNKDSVWEILDRAEASQLVAALAAGGPVEAAARAGVDDWFKKKYSHRRELSRQVLTDQ